MGLDRGIHQAPADIPHYRPVREDVLFYPRAGGAGRAVPPLRRSSLAAGFECAIIPRFRQGGSGDARRCSSTGRRITRQEISLVQKAASLALASLVLATLACGLPSPSAEPTSPPTDSAVATPSAEPEEPLPVSMSQAVSAGVEAGSWTEAEGIARSLSYLTGERSAEEVFGDQPLMASEGTRVVRRAQIYMANPANSQGRDEITRLLAILVPSRQTLDRFSQPASASLGAAGLAHPVERPQGDAVICRALWSTAFEVAEGEPDPICLEYVEIGIGGLAHRIYYPSYWEEDARERALLEPSRQALERSLETYNA
jgi:hypothetical protein